MIRKRKSRHAVRRDVVIEPPPFIYVSNHGERPVYLRWAKVDRLEPGCFELRVGETIKVAL